MQAEMHTSPGERQPLSRHMEQRADNDSPTKTADAADRHQHEDTKDDTDIIEKRRERIGDEAAERHEHPGKHGAHRDRRERRDHLDLFGDVALFERARALLPTLGGQTALNTAMSLFKSGVLEKHNLRMIGAKAEAIEKGEDRLLFKNAMLKIGLDLPRSGVAHTIEEARQVAEEIGTLPLIIRPAYTLGGTGGGIAYNREEFAEIVREHIVEPRRALVLGIVQRGIDHGIPPIIDGGSAHTLLVIVGGWFAARPIVVAPIAGLFGKVGR